jgi:hypothetical protein
MESERPAFAAKEAEARRALGPQIVEDAKRLVADWNERQSKHMPLFSPTLEAAVLTRHYFLWVRCPACRTTAAGDLRGVRAPRRPQRKSFSFDRAAVCTAEIFQRKIAVSRMEINDGLHRQLAASGTRIIEIKAQRHVTPPLARRVPLSLRSRASCDGAHPFLMLRHRSATV